LSGLWRSAADEVNEDRLEPYWLDGLRAFMLRSLATGKRKEKDYRTHANQDDCEPNE
jgi:hypothetical protein